MARIIAHLNQNVYTDSCPDIWKMMISMGRSGEFNWGIISWFFFYSYEPNFDHIYHIIWLQLQISYICNTQSINKL